MDALTTELVKLLRDNGLEAFQKAYADATSIYNVIFGDEDGEDGAKSGKKSPSKHYGEEFSSLVKNYLLNVEKKKTTKIRTLDLIDYIADNSDYPIKRYREKLFNVAREHGWERAYDPGFSNSKWLVHKGAAQEGMLPAPPDVLLKKIYELELSVRSANCLRRDNIVYVGDLIQKSEAELLRQPNFGLRSLDEIKEVLASMGLHLQMEVPNWPPGNFPIFSQDTN